MFIRFLFFFDLLFNIFRIALCRSGGKELSPWLFTCYVLYFSAVLIVGATFPFGYSDRMWNSIVSVPDHCIFIYFTSLCNNQGGVVRLTRFTLQPMEVRDVCCFERKACIVESAITEPLDSETGTKVGRPRIVLLESPGKTAQMPVMIFNHSITSENKRLPATRSKSSIMKEDNRLPLDNNTPLRTAQVNQQSAGPDTIMPKVDLVGATCKLSPEEGVKLEQLLRKWQKMFSKCHTDLGCTHLVEHEIKLKDETPFKEPYRRIPSSLIQEVMRENLNEVLEVSAIRNSKTPFSSNVMIVRKKAGTNRFYIDYRKLNQRTVSDTHSVPRINDTLYLLAKAKSFQLYTRKFSFLKGGLA